MSKRLTVTGFFQFLENNAGMLMDGRSVSYNGEPDDQSEVAILDMDDDYPEVLLDINEDNATIEVQDDGTALVHIDEDGSTDTYYFQPLNVLINGQPDESFYLDRKEMIAGILFEDNELSEDYIAPSETDCHTLADLILKRLGLS
jgi:hypothetical protein